MNSIAALMHNFSYDASVLSLSLECSFSINARIGQGNSQPDKDIKILYNIGIVKM